MGEAGELPHIWQHFSDGTKIRYGLTLFPGGTEVIYPRLKAGQNNAVHHLVGWGYLDRATDATYGDAHVFMEMLGYFPRRSRSHFFTGLPVLEVLNELYLHNIPHLFAKYDVLEFLWFNTDVVGHLWGPDAHRSSIRRFDAALGRLLEQEGMDQINLILYTDHGMSMGPMELVDFPPLLQKHVGADVRYFSYPNLYLHAGADAQYYAEALGRDPQIDLAFVWVEDDRLRGIHSDGHIDIHGWNHHYRYEAVGADPFGYDSLAVGDRYLDRDQWLDSTKDSDFPGAVPNIYKYMTNSFTGDIVLVLNPFKIPESSIGSQGGHAGLHATDLLVPVLLRGPATDHLRDLEYLWLHELYSVHLPMIDFSNRSTSEPNQAAVFGPWQEPSWSMRLQLSPAYRWQWGVELGSQDYQGWFAFDVYSSFLIRLWTGLAVVDHDFAWYRAVEASLGHLNMKVQRLGSEQVQAVVTVELSPQWNMVFHSQRGLGLQVRF